MTKASTTNEPAALTISCKLENLLVERNLRGMGRIQSALKPGYLLRAARLLLDGGEGILIATGFPVFDTCETDGPVGAVALQRACAALGKRARLACEQPLVAALCSDFDVISLPLTDDPAALDKALDQVKVDLLVSIERPGLSADGRYYNMRGEDISARVSPLDGWRQQLNCACIAMGDGGNELGMGNIVDALGALDITPASSRCTELIIADVSNWAAYGLIAMLGWLSQRDLLAAVEPEITLRQLAGRGIIDGVTRRGEATEDGLPAAEGLAVIDGLRRLCGQR